METAYLFYLRPIGNKRNYIEMDAYFMTYVERYILEHYRRPDAEVTPKSYTFWSDIQFEVE